MTAPAPPSDPRALACIQPHLEPGETALWAYRARPLSVLAYHWRYFLGCALGVAFVAWVAGRWLETIFPGSVLEWRPGAIEFAFVALVAIGAYAWTIKPFVRVILPALDTTYAITDRRVVATGALPWRWCRSRALDAVTISCVATDFGHRGTVDFGVVTPFHTETMPERWTFPFIDLPNAAAVAAFAGATIESNHASRRRETPVAAPVPSDREAILRNTLDVGERILWRGCPDAAGTLRQSLRVRSAGTLVRWVVLGAVVVIFIAVFTVIVVATHARSFADPAAPDSGAFFAVAGGVVFYLFIAMIGRHQLQRWRRLRSTIYAVTDRRVVIASVRPYTEVASFAPEMLNVTAIVNRAGPRADIILREEEIGEGGYRSVKRTWFRQIEDPDAVRDLLLDLRAKADRAAESL